MCKNMLVFLESFTSNPRAVHKLRNTAMERRMLKAPPLNPWNYIFRASNIDPTEGH